MSDFRLTGYPAVLLLASALLGSSALAATPSEIQQAYGSQAGVPADPLRGQQMFTSRHGRDWSCATCHGAVPTAPGQHAATNKVIAPLAPAFNAARFSDAAKTEKWFRRNCNDVMGRECSASEKADIIAWLRTLQ